MYLILFKVPFVRPFQACFIVAICAARCALLARLIGLDMPHYPTMKFKYVVQDGKLLTSRGRSRFYFRSKAFAGALIDNLASV